jgi:FkbM family methyltransferase
MIKKIIKRVIDFFISKLSLTVGGRYIHRQLIDEVMSKVKQIEYKGVIMLFSTPNLLNEYRANSFSDKEPETLEWIQNFKSDTILWDVGANVGLYSCYAAKKKNCKVIAFEPSVFNLELLARNIYINDLVDKVTIFPLPLNNITTPNKLNMTTTQWGGALSSFGEIYGQDGKELNKVFEFQTYGCSMDSISQFLKLPLPNYLKIDVDGIEHLILQGGSEILSHVKSVLIEINDDFTEQADKCEELLEKAGLSLIEKRHNKELENTSMRNSFNQVWTRI